MSAFRAFRKKLEIGDIQEEGLLHYPKLKSLASGTQHHSYVEFLDKLIEIFWNPVRRFPSGKTGLIVHWKSIPGKEEFSIEALKVCPWASVASIQSELIKLQKNLALQESLCDPATFWTKIVSAAGVPALQKMTLNILTIFPSAYCCELAFSTMIMGKNKCRSTLINEDLHQCLRMALKPFVPKFKEPVAQKKWSLFTLMWTEHIILRTLELHHHCFGPWTDSNLVSGPFEFLIEYPCTNVLLQEVKVSKTISSLKVISCM